MSRKQNKPNTDNIFITNLSKYTTPSINEVRNKEWIEYGNDNNFFQYLIDRFTGSTTNNAVINGVSRMIYGKGIAALDSNKKTESYAQMLSIFSKDDLRRFITDRKMLGMAAFQVLKKGKKITKVIHFPMNTLRAEKLNDDGIIEAWYYHPDWAELKPSDEPKRIPVLGFGNGNEPEICVLQPYVAGYYYYSPVDYVGALPYSVLEEEIGDYLINDTINGFSGKKVVNFNNGIPDAEKMHEIKRDVLKKLTGATGDPVIVSFNNNAESATTVEDLQLNDAPQHYQYLSDECRNKLIIGHSITSPMLIGVRETGGGLGNNADEIKTASLLFDNITIRPFQEEVIEVMDKILAVNDISLKLYFKTIQPLEFVDTNGQDKDTKEEETGVKMSKNDNFDDDFGIKMLENLKKYDLTDEWELVDKREYSEDNETVDSWANKLIKSKQNLLARIIKSKPSAKSTLDKNTYKVRYEYSEKYSSGKSRDFCNQMMSRTSSGVVYRKEDIDQASFQGVNKEFGHNKNAYSLFKYKGGVNCGHYWSENLYRLKTKTDGTPFEDKALSSSEEVDSIEGYNPKPNGLEDAKKAPKDMPRNGHHPNYKG